MVHIKRHKKGGRVYLAEYESYRGDDGKPKTRFVRYVGVEGEPIKKTRQKGKTLDRIRLRESHRAGDVRLLWELAMNLDLPRIIDRICCGISDDSGPTPGKLLTVWAINRCIYPESVSQLESWVPTTDLPRLTGLNPADFTKDAFYRALDFVVSNTGPQSDLVDYTSDIDATLYNRWRELFPLESGEEETVAYDMTTILFFGVSCPLTEIGYNPDNIKRVQANLALLVNKKEKHPIFHFVYEGSRSGANTVKNLLSRLTDSSIRPGTIVWDRGMMSQEHVDAVLQTGWDLVAGVPKSRKDAVDIIDGTPIPHRPQTLVRRGPSGKIYAVGKTDTVYGHEMSLAVYSNKVRESHEIDKRNDALNEIGEALDELARKGRAWGESKLHSKIKTLTRGYTEFLDVQVKRKGDGPRVSWKYKSRALDRSDRLCGKWLILSTKDRPLKETVDMYLEKDYIEKVFRTLKTDEEIVPVRHRLERRVRAYVFVCVLAYRLTSYLQHLISMHGNPDDSWDSAYSLLNSLGSVQRAKVVLGNESKCWYLNLSKKDAEILKAIGMDGLFKTEIELET